MWLVGHKWHSALVQSWGFLWNIIVKTHFRHNSYSHISALQYQSEMFYYSKRSCGYNILDGPVLFSFLVDIYLGTPFLYILDGSVHNTGYFMLWKINQFFDIWNQVALMCNKEIPKFEKLFSFLDSLFHPFNIYIPLKTQTRLITMMSQPNCIEVLLLY